MKMTKTDFALLTKELNNVETILKDRAGNKHSFSSISKQYFDNDLSVTRFIWDMFRGIETKKRIELIDHFYTYLHDSHIDTALKAYFKNRGLTL